MQSKFPEEVKRDLAIRGVVAVLMIENVKDAVPVAKALVHGGVTAIELALRTDAAMDAIKAIRKGVPEMFICAGTVIQNGQAKALKDLGVAMAVSPGFNPAIVQEAIACDLPFAPGISTASELERAYMMGCDVLKFFPAEQLGGIKYLNSMAGPYKYLGIRFFPLGGLSKENCVEWAKRDDVIAFGGSWIANSSLIAAGNYQEITKRAAEAIAIWKEARS